MSDSDSDSEQEQIVKISKAEYELAAFYTDWLKPNNVRGGDNPFETNNYINFAS
jgi:hypothetical protein